MGAAPPPGTLPLDPSPSAAAQCGPRAGAGSISEAKPEAVLCGRGGARSAQAASSLCELRAGDSAGRTPPRLPRAAPAPPRSSPADHRQPPR